MMLTNPNCIHEETDSKLNSGNACYDAVQNFSFHLLSKHAWINMYITIILVALHWCETWPLMLREEHRLICFRIECSRG